MSPAARRRAFALATTIAVATGIAAAARPAAARETTAPASAPRAARELRSADIDRLLAAEWRKRAGTPDVLRERPGGSVVTYGTTALDISASAIRAHFAQARSPRYLLPSAVLDYIEAHALYAHPGGAP